MIRREVNGPGTGGQGRAPVLSGNSDVKGRRLAADIRIHPEWTSAGPGPKDRVCAAERI